MTLAYFSEMLLYVVYWAQVQFCTASMSAITIMKLTKHGAIIPTHTPCLEIANMTDMEAVRNCISTCVFLFSPMF